ncbi:hypothetical protein KSF_011550 [Reticulibacter mediterranei]|uniref:Uncharacterized protein n=1 Tax=Reticulibacter mediterranei TaxID=2778369 RepID=A0A8J3IGJ9_9CHLR|nr:hypothetical protein KSF_011550 [Reticulibacter mediterranei]
MRRSEAKARADTISHTLEFKIRFFTGSHGKPGHLRRTGVVCQPLLPGKTPMCTPSSAQNFFNS